MGLKILYSKAQDFETLKLLSMNIDSDRGANALNYIPYFVPKYTLRKRTRTASVRLYNVYFGMIIKEYVIYLG